MSNDFLRLGSNYNNFELQRKDPQEVLNQFAKQKNLSEEDAKAKLESMYGAPQPPMQGPHTQNQEQNSFSIFAPNSMNQPGFNQHQFPQFNDSNNFQRPNNNEYISNHGNLNPNGQNQIPEKELYALIDAGIPLSVIQQGDNAIKTYAEENNIDIPAKQQLNIMC